eukprot:TRINITY_DN65274_c0_g1_i1.p1 TRINITY_DN65274_c0_g1~~TRINITY_DN65274_c0_g1_i1.p1  ORF type:complete len:694 (+),score=86.69 TRINITY_DN65274_c0_g1_i1:171-2084(+)
MEQVVESKVQALVDLVQECGVPLKEASAIVRRGTHVFGELGLAAFIYYLRECVAPQLQAHLERLSELNPSGRPSGIKLGVEKTAQLRQVMKDAADRLANSGDLTKAPNVTHKARMLLELVRNLNQLDPGTRIIIFCEQTVLAYPLAHLVQEHVSCRAGTCTGVGSMTDSQRKQALQNFRSGEIPILTCTAALEEGLDVSECEVVIRFSSFKTTKSHIQGAGRARAWNAKVYYFDNDPNFELQGAALMELTARADSLSLTHEELIERREHKDVAGVHPYRTSAGAEISIFNCVQMVYEYAAGTMGQSFRPEENMLTYVEDVVCTFPLVRRRKLVRATIPSPDGFFDLVAETVDNWWGETDLDDVAEKSRMKNWDGSKKELRRFLYVVAVEMSKRGLFDEYNKPSAKAIRETRLRCEAWTMSAGVRVGPKYDSQGLQNGGASTPVSRQNGSNESARAQASQLDHPLQARASQQIQAESGNGCDATDNFKGKLNELTNSEAKYVTVGEGSGFRSTVTLPCGKTFVGSTIAQTKKAAEQLAAKSALQDSTYKFSPQTRAISSAASAPASTNQVNYKGQVNELTNTLAVYETLPAPGGGFISTVTLPGGARVVGDSASTKKEAEQLAAKAALSQGIVPGMRN